MGEPANNIRDLQLKRMQDASDAAGGSDKQIAKPAEAEPQYIYSLAEMWKGRHIKPRFLIPDLIPGNAVSLVIGEDGIGKTQLFTQLCLSVCYGHDKFLSLQLNPIYKTALIIATEDSKEKFISAAQKQLLYFDPHLVDDSPMVDLDFMEAADLENWKHFRKVVEKRLKSKKYDIIVIDAFSDVFTYLNGEINDNGHARTLLGAFQTWAKTNEVAVIVIHHAAKTKIVEIHKSGKLLIEKNSSQGAGAITQKPRTILALSHNKDSEDPDTKTSINYFHVVKANVMSKKYMKEILECTFSEAHLIHEFNRIAKPEEIDLVDGPEAPITKEVTEAGQTRTVHPRNIDLSTHYILVGSMFDQQAYFALRKDMAPFISANYKISNRAAEKDYIPYLIEKDIIRKNGLGFVFGGDLNALPLAPNNGKDPDDDDEIPF